MIGKLVKLLLDLISLPIAFAIDFCTYSAWSQRLTVIDEIRWDLSELKRKSL